MLELLELKELYRTKHGLYIENEMGERGSFNHKTKPYWCCKYKKRISHPNRKGVNTNGHISCGTFNSYREALVSSLEYADFFLEKLTYPSK